MRSNKRLLEATEAEVAGQFGAAQKQPGDGLSHEDTESWKLEAVYNSGSEMIEMRAVL